MHQGLSHLESALKVKRSEENKTQGVWWRNVFSFFSFFFLLSIWFMADEEVHLTPFTYYRIWSSIYSIPSCNMLPFILRGHSLPPSLNIVAPRHSPIHSLFSAFILGHVSLQWMICFIAITFCIVVQGLAPCRMLSVSFYKRATI